MRIQVIAALLVGSLLAGCGGGASGSGSGRIVSVPPVLPQGGSKAPAKISLTIPASAAPSAKRRSTIPSTTQSVVLNFSGPNGAALSPTVAPVIINVTACSPFSGGYQCSTTVTLPFGTVIVSIAAYAGTNGTGALLALGTLTLTVSTTGSTTADAVLTTASNYGAFGGNTTLSNINIDHVADTFTVNESVNGSAGTINGTITPLSNGDVMATVTSGMGAASGIAVGDIVLIRELANGAIVIEDSGIVSPPSPWTGATGGSDAGIAFGIANAACASGSVQFNFDAVSVSGPGFVSSGASATPAYFVGSGTGSATTLTGAASGYDINGNDLGSQNSGTLTCSNDAYYPPVADAATEPALAFNSLGVFLGLSGNGTDSTPGEIGIMGFANPQTVNTAQVLAQSYDGFITVGGSMSSAEPFTATPLGGGLQVCPYTDIVNNVPATGLNCFAFTLTGQPSPGILTGTSPANGATVIVSVGQINGKYVLLGLANSATSTTPGFAGNFVLFQH